MDRKDSGARGLACFLLAALVFAYRDLLLAGVREIAKSDLVSLVFVPGEDTLLVGLVVAGLLVFRRRAAFAAPGAKDSQFRSTSAQPGWAVAGLAAALLVLAWSGYVDRPELALLSLAIGLTSTAAVCNGAGAAQMMFLPALVLVLSIPLPAPVESEWVWALQKATASATSTFLDLLGFNSTLEGIRISLPRLAFEVTESCSGLRPVQILLPIAIAIGDAAGLREGRLFSFASLTVLLALLLNAGRLVAEGARLDPTGATAAPDLRLQGLLLIGLAVTVLALSARVLRRSANPAEAEAEQEAASAKSDEPEIAAWRTPRKLLFATAGLAIIASLSPAFVSNSQPGRTIQAVPRPSLAAKSGGWVSHEIAPNYTFPYSTSSHRRLVRRYAPSKPIPGVAPGTIEVFVVYEARGAGGPDRIPTTKLPLPDSDWEIQQHTLPRTDLLPERTISVTELTRNDASERALAYSWRIRDRGFLQESLRALLGLNPNPDGAMRPRAVVRLATSMGAGLRSDRSRAKKLLDRFIRDFEKELEAL